MKEKVKYFRTTEMVLDKFEKLKEIYSIQSDSDLFSRIVEDIINIKQNKLIPIELYEKIEMENKKLYLEVGKLQGELNIYKQQALPKKSFWKRLFGG